MTALTKEQNLLLQLMQLSMRGETVDRMEQLGDVEWKPFLQEAKMQTVLLGVYYVLEPVMEQLPQEVQSTLFQYAMGYTASNVQNSHCQSELVKLLTENHWPYVILKGEASQSYYTNPAVRQMGDVDFLVPVSCTEAITEKMKAQGFQHTWEDGDYHQVFKKTRACLEMHMEIAGMPKGKFRPVLEQYMQSIYDDSVLKDQGGGYFCAPGDAHHGMILLLHMQHHVVAMGMGLRQVMDWAHFVQKTADLPFWQERFLPQLAEVGLKHFAAVMTKMSAIYLGIACPAWAEYVEEDLCQGMMEDILAGGNFGRKDEERVRAQNMIPDYEKNQKGGRIRLLYHTLYHSVVDKQPHLEKKPVLLGFKMIGKTFRYVALSLQGKRPNLIKAAEHAEVRRSVYDRLEMYETKQ